MTNPVAIGQVCPMCRVHTIADLGRCPHCDHPCVMGGVCRLCSNNRDYEGTGPGPKLGGRFR